MSYLNQAKKIGKGIVGQLTSIHKGKKSMAANGVQTGPLKVARSYGSESSIKVKRQGEVLWRFDKGENLAQEAPPRQVGVIP